MKGIFIFLILFPMWATAAQDTAVVHEDHVLLLRRKQVYAFTDFSEKLPFSKIKTLTDAFQHPVISVPNFGLSDEVHWVRFTILNKTGQDEISIRVKNPNLNNIRLYYPITADGKHYAFLENGNLVPISRHPFGDQTSIFNITMPENSARTFYLTVESTGRIPIPISIGTAEQIVKECNLEDLIFGLYLGAIIVMLLYNLFIYVILKYRSYLFYSIFLFLMGFTLFSLYGYGYRFLWSAHPYITLQSISLPKILLGISMILFLREFLYTEKTLPFYDKIVLSLVGLGILTIPLSLFGLYNLSLFMADFLNLITCLVFLEAGIKLFAKGFESAKYFLMAWSFLIACIIIDIFRDFNIVPYNLFTSNALFVGSTIEVALLTFALADKINSYKNEKDLAQAKALKSAQEKEEVILRENGMLEVSVAERTAKLEKTNKELQAAIKNLKLTESQLIHAEKMASIGQLTAGIAHEINNPINYIKSNVHSLQLDIDDLMALLKIYQEIDAENLVEKQKEIDEFIQSIELDTIRAEVKTLLASIREGAVRTAEIAQGLRKFSRIDEHAIKRTNIHEGIDATLQLIGNITPKNITIIRNYGDIPEVECYPGPLNQVFMNILTNSIQAILSSDTLASKEQYVVITTRNEEDLVYISIKDTGPGIPAEIKKDIFNPFFTTKDVGEGTGLGLSISYGIIKDHNGSIKVFSEEEGGSEFIITLPVHQNVNVGYDG